MIAVPTADAAEAAQKTRIRGEMLAIRAMAHLELLGTTCILLNIPLTNRVVIQRNYSKDVATYFPARNTQAEVVAFIDSNLSEARTLIPFLYGYQPDHPQCGDRFQARLA